MRALPALLLLGTLAVTGCLEPYRVHVDPATLAAAPGWTEVKEGMRGDGLGPRTQETRYTFDPASANPPFPGTLQLFSVRSLSRLSQAELLDLAQKAVEDGAQSHNIQLDGTVLEGRRTLANGVKTQWVLRTGSTTEAGAVFDDQVRLHVLAEAGHDGRSETSFLAVAIVQVERAQQCPLLACAPVRDQATWVRVAGDPEGSIDGATSTSGFIDHVVSR